MPVEFDGEDDAAASLWLLLAMAGDVGWCFLPGKSEMLFAAEALAYAAFGVGTGLVLNSARNSAIAWNAH